MPGRGRAEERDYTEEERAAILSWCGGGHADPGTKPDPFDLLADRCYDVYLNDTAYWRCIPSRVWDYALGGYQVIKKWLSYREKELLGRPLKVEEVREVTAMARRMAGILLMEGELDADYNIACAMLWQIRCEATTPARGSKQTTLQPGSLWESQK
jgi:hypothetical protein